jgi:hypothetical protein
MMFGTHHCLRCGIGVVHGGYRDGVAPICTGCRTDDNPPIHPHWANPGPIEIDVLRWDHYDTPRGAPRGSGPSSSFTTFSMVETRRPHNEQ